MTPLCIDLGSLGLSEFDGGLGQLSQRKHLLDFLSQEIKLEVFICFSPRWTWWVSCSQCASSTRRRRLGSSWLTSPTTRSPPSSSTFSGPTIASVDFDPRLSQLPKSKLISLPSSPHKSVIMSSLQKCLWSPLSICIFLAKKIILTTFCICLSSIRHFTHWVPFVCSQCFETCISKNCRHRLGPFTSGGKEPLYP